MGRKLDSSALNVHLDDLEIALRRKRTPLKYTYIGTADDHDKLVHSDDYGLANEEIKLLRHGLIARLQSKIRGQRLTVTDIGPGNGQKAIQVLEILQKTVPEITYVGVDISKNLLRTTKNAISKALPNIHIVTHEYDFERDSLRPIRGEADKTTLWLLLGQTLGNPFDREEALLNIRKGMGPEDILVVGVELYRQNRVQDILSHYRNETFIQSVIAYTIFLGFQREDGEVSIVFNPATRNVEAWFKFARNISLKIKDRVVIDFRRGEELLVFVSHRFEIDELHKLFAQARLNVVTTEYNETSSYTLLFAEPTH